MKVSFEIKTGFAYECIVLNCSVETVSSVIIPLGVVVQIV